MKKLIIVLVMIVASIAQARTATHVKDIYGNVLHTIQNGWVILESENSADTQATALTKAKRTKKIVEALILAAASGDDNISVFEIPATWNGGRFRSIGITDNGAAEYEIYLGSTGGADDCELTYAGQLAFVTGTQVSTYYQIGITSGSYQPKKGDIVTGNSSSETAVVVSVTEPSSGGWATSDAVAVVTYQSKSGAFTNSETIALGDGLWKKADIYTHAGSDLVGFELADTCVTTAGAWGSNWQTTSPADDDTNAEAELVDFKGADFMVILTSTAAADCKLLGKGL